MKKKTIIAATNNNETYDFILNITYAFEHWNLKRLGSDADINQHVLRKDVDLLIIDYLQLMRGMPGRYENRNQEITEITRSLKALAKEIECPIMALSQLSRDTEKRKGSRKPVLSDLRESGSIEQDADIVLFLFREGYYTNQDVDINEREKKKMEGTEGVTPPTDLIIAKHRSGPTGSVKLVFTESITRFDNYTDIEQV